jgi:hypothetical protein
LHAAPDYAANVVNEALARAVLAIEHLHARAAPPPHGAAGGGTANGRADPRPRR